MFIFDERLIDIIKFFNTYLKNKMKTKLLILSAIFTLFSCNKSEQKIEESTEIEKIDSVAKKESPESEIPKELIKAPDFSLADINGKRFDLSDFKGKYVYMDIWATWCGPCKVQIPFMKELEKQFHDAPIHFVSVSLDKLEGDLQQDIEKVQTNLISEEDYQKILNGIENSFVASKSGVQNIAHALADAYMLGGDTNKINEELKIYQSVTREDIRNVAKKYLNKNQRVNNHYLT